RIYHRKVDFVGHHDDAGQSHDDLWHRGIYEWPRQTVRSLPRRGRVEFRAYGVGPGAAAYSRHLSALRETMVENDVWKLAELTVAALHDDEVAATSQNREPPRDLRLQDSLDEFVRDELTKLSRDSYRRANREYVEWLKEGYRRGLLGVRKERERLTVSALDRVPKAYRRGSPEETVEHLVELAKSVDQVRATLETVKVESSRLEEENRSVSERLHDVTREKGEMEDMMDLVFKDIPECADPSVPMLQRIRNLSVALLDKQNYIDVLKHEKELAEAMIRNVIAVIQKAVDEFAPIALRPFRNVVAQICEVLKQNIPAPSPSVRVEKSSVSQEANKDDGPLKE
nr:hypothetical protein [Terrimicrobiaceae bacterium]